MIFVLIAVITVVAVIIPEKDWRRTIMIAVLIAVGVIPTTAAVVVIPAKAAEVVIPATAAF